MTHILAIDPGLCSGVAFLNTEQGTVTTAAIDMRPHGKETVGESVVAFLEGSLSVEPEMVVVLEDFVLRQGQSVDDVPMYILGAVDAALQWQTFKYLPASHKKGNNAYDISKIIKDSGQSTFEGHATDALSLALHHWKITDTKNAVEFLQEYKK